MNKQVLLLTEAIPGDRITLAVIRSLSKAGFCPTVASHTFRGGSFHSRHAYKRLPFPHPAMDLSGFVKALGEQLIGGEYTAVIPTSNYLAFTLSQLKNELSGLHELPVADAEASTIAKDKLRTVEFAVKLGLAVPQTFCPQHRSALVDLVETLEFPCILKPRVTAGAIGMCIARSVDELLEAYDSLPDMTNPVFDFRRPLLQEKIEGNIHEVCALFCRGQARALMTQKRLLMHPAGGGAGIYNETTDEPDLKDLAVRLLEGLNWHGPAQVEFLRDSKNNKPYLVEINGRLWGTLDLSIAAGMDFPTLACRMAMDGDVKPQYDYRVGLRYRWPFPFAILYAMETGRWAASFRDFLLPRSSTRSDLSLSDPMPLIMEFWYTLDRFRKNGFKTVRSDHAWSEMAAWNSGDRK